MTDTANVINADELEARRAMRDAKAETTPEERKYFSIKEYALQLWDKPEAARKVLAHYAGRLLRWQVALRQDASVEKEIELLEEALRRALTAKELKDIKS